METKDKLDYTDKQLHLLTSEIKEKIKQMTEDVEEKVRQWIPCLLCDPLMSDSLL